MKKELKELKYDIEIIIDYKQDMFFKYTPQISTHRIFQDITLKELYKILKLNNYENEDYKVYINIRGMCKGI